MSRYIDADKVHQFVDDKVAEGKDGWAKGVPYEWAYALAVIDNAPTADVVEVRHGTWYHGTENGARKMRDRLIELLNECRAIEGLGMELIAKQADHLLSHGVIAPPCYIGQEIWHITKHYDGRNEIRKGKVSMLQQKSDKSWKIRITVNSSVWDFTPDEIGREYFLTKEEAERALERSENGK